jgi:hypothetical protein
VSRSSERLLLLACAGCASGLLGQLAVGLAPARYALFLPGLIFGIAVTLVFASHGGFNAPFKAVGFIAASTAAYPISVLATFATMPIVTYLGLNNNVDSGGAGRIQVPPSAIFIDGSLGALIVLLGARMVFGSFNLSLRCTLRVALASLAGGVFGVAGWLASNGGQSQHAAISGSPLSFCALYLIWQTGVALCIGPVVAGGERPAARGQYAPRSRTLGLTAVGLFFAMILGALGWLIYGNVTGASYLARREDARRRMILEAPPPAMLPQIEAIAPERAVIEENIGGYFAKGPMVSTVAAHPAKPGFAPSWPSYVLYTMLYEPTEEPSGLGVDAQVMQYPSSGWARYKAMYPDVNPTDPDEFTLVTRFGNKVFMDTSLWFGRGGTLSFRWTSGTNSVVIRYTSSSGSINEEFLKRYLEKYPSSL